MLPTLVALPGCNKGCDGHDDPPPAKTVSVGTQSGTITAGTTGKATLAVTTANIEDVKRRGGLLTLK